MAWIARLDANAARWSRPAYWSYLSLKWSLVALGAFALGGVLLDRIGMWSLY